MKHFILFLGAIVMLSMSSLAQNCSLPSNLQNGLVGYWPFSGNTVDESSNGNDGINSGVDFGTDRFGNVGSAGLFDGNDYVLIENAISQISAATVSGWYNSAAVQGAAFVQFGNDNPNSGCTGMAIGQGEGDFIGDGNNLQAAFNCNPGWIPGFFELPNPGTWTHFAMVKSPGRLSLYINGMLVGYRVTGEPTFDLQTIFFGASSTALDYSFQGLLDDIYIYDRSLSHEEISELFSSNSGLTARITSNGNPTLSTGSLITLSANEGNYNYQWLLNGSPISGENQQDLTPIESGSYAVVIDNGFCVSTSLSMEITLTDNPILCELPEGSFSDNVIGFWPFCGTYHDMGPNAHNTVSSGPELATDRFGTPNAAYHFNGSSDYMIVENALTNLDTISLVGWFNSDGIQGASFAYLGVNSPVYGCDGIGIGQGEGDYISDGNNYHTEFGCSGGWLGPGVLLPTPGTWNQFGFSKAGSNYNIYLNGQLVQSYTLSTPTLPANWIFFGAASPGGDYAFSGSLDDLILFDRALSTYEFMQHYTGNYEPIVCTPLPATLQNGLVGYWPFCGNANDESGNGNDGVVNGAALTEDRFGNVESAFEFSEAEQNSIDVGNNPNFNFESNSNFTISLWAKNNSLLSINNEAVGYYMYKGNGGGNNKKWLLGDFATPFSNGDFAYVFHSNDELGNFNWLGDTTSHEPDFIEWNHIVFSREDGVMRVFRNGELINTETIDNLPNYYNDSNLFFGRGENVTINAKLDDVGIWNRALTAEEIALLYGNFNPQVTGCTAPEACNYDALATTDDGSCTFAGDACDDGNAATTNDILGADCGCAGTTVELGTPHTCGADFVHNPNLNYGSMTDQEGNVYKTIVIGDQEWMAENLNTSIYRNGDAIATNLDATTWASTTIGAWAYSNDNGALQCPYGKLYNWYTCIDERELCPTGWRIPSTSDWFTLIDNLGGQSVAGGKMRSTGSIEDANGLWFAPNVNASNSSGFSGVPAGYRFFGGEYYNTGDLGDYWSSSENGGGSAWYINLVYYYNSAQWDPGNKHYGFSVRCMREATTGLIPGCIDLLACNYNSTATVDDGSCLYQGASCDDANASTYNDIIDASCGCTGTPIELGVEHTCGAPLVHNPSLNYGSMTDQEGNVYKTIVIGDQEWMAENLNTSIYRNGEQITTNLTNTEWEGASTTEIGAWGYYNNEEILSCPNGKLYNWYACVDPRELCPSGWRVPSSGDWSALLNYIDPTSNPSDFVESFFAGTALKSTGTIEGGTGLWYENAGDVASNSSGFSATPGGQRHIFGDYNSLGNYGFWWSSTGYANGVAAYINLLYYTSEVYSGIYDKPYGFSVRCVRDANTGLIPGCTTPEACNYNALATTDDGSCTFAGDACDDANAATTNDILGADCGCAGSAVELGTPHTCGADFVHNPNLTYGTMTDQEGNVYKTIVIGEQEWMAENLNTSIYRNGDAIATNLNNSEWQTTTAGAWSYMGDNIGNSCPNGKLYNLYAVQDERHVCPTGWHEANSTEWDELTNYLGGVNLAGGKMKSSGIQYWFSPNTGADNSSGFSALPGGFRDLDGSYAWAGNYGFWWMADDNTVLYRRLDWDGPHIFGDGYNPQLGFGVRCIRDDENTGLIPGCTDPLASNYDPLATVNEGCEYTSTVFVYNDLNGNGMHEADEPGLGNWPVLVSNLNILLWTNANGYVYLPLPSGVQELEVLNPTDNWVITTASTATVDFATGVSTASFGLQVIPGEAIVAAGPYQGFWEILHCTDGYESGVYIENIGSQPVSGFLTLDCDPLFTPDADSYFTTPPTETGPGYALWNIEDFLPGEFELLSFHIDGPGVDYIGQFFNFEFNLNLFDPQGNMIHSETWNVAPEVACAYDPNDITGFPEGLNGENNEGYLDPHFILEGHEVTFVVRFQNTGNYPAEDVHIDIPLDPEKWDIGSFTPFHASALDMGCLHDDGSYDLEFDSNYVVVKFVLEDIYLPDSVSNEEGSHGFVSFRINARQDLNPGTELYAKAYIYFDANPAVITNETTHTIFSCDSFSPPVGQNIYCEGETIAFNAEQPYVDNYTWTLDNATAGTGSSFTYPSVLMSPDIPAEYSLELTTSNALCPLVMYETEAEAHQVFIVVNPTPSLYQHLSDTLCAGEEVAYDAQSNGTVYWMNGAVNGSSTIASESFTAEVYALSNENCSSDTLQWAVTVNPLPSTEVDNNNNVLTAVDGIAWQWSVNGAEDVTTQSITASVSGNYQVEITNEFECTATSELFVITDVSFVNSWPTLTAYPNPMKDQARLELPKGVFDIALYDMTGACVRAMQNQQGVAIIERESLASGVYQVRITQGEHSTSVRLVIE